jgi:cephalosporin hydroxylase
MIELHYGGMNRHFNEEDITKPGLHYKTLCDIPSDINEHLPTLKKYSEECDVITEMGVRFGCSTWAFVEGKPKKLTCIDIDKGGFEPSEKYVKQLCEEYKIDFNWVTGDSLKIEMDNTDLLFIDTLHNYNQLIGELRRHESKVSKYIILHDTETFGMRDEGIYDNSSDIIKNMAKGKSGLIAAVQDFLQENKSWSIKEVYHNNNGLTVLQRTNEI